MAGSPSTWITRLDDGSGGMRVAVKDLLDVAGTPTTAGCRAVALHARAAARDADCLGGLRAAVGAGRATLVGKTNLDELALGISGVNPWFGTPANPADPRRVPGGSSSGAAAAVGSGEADVAVGTDTAGSIRIPAACCGVAGLKTTAGRISRVGVWPLAPSLDTVGPLARDVAGLVATMALLEPGFATAPAPDGPIGRLRAGGGHGQAVLSAEPAVEAALDAALAAAGLGVVDVFLPGWLEAARAALHILGAEAAALHRDLTRARSPGPGGGPVTPNAGGAGGAAAATSPGGGDVEANTWRPPEGVGSDALAALAEGSRTGHQQLLGARSLGRRWRARLDQQVFTRVVALALPVLDGVTPFLDGDFRSSLTVRWTAPLNLAGLPAVALPVPLAGVAAGTGTWSGSERGGPPVPTSLQLVGPAGSEDVLLGLAGRIEAALSRQPR